LATEQNRYPNNKQQKLSGYDNLEQLKKKLRHKKPSKPKSKVKD
jgi:hypothetical protein